MELIAKPIIDKEIEKIKNIDCINNVCLVVYQIDNDSASCSYIKSKTKMFNDVNAKCIVKHFDSNETSAKDIENEIIKDNNNNSINGIIIQQPVPQEYKYLTNIVSCDKDVDGFVKNSKFVSCTALGICDLINYYNISTENKNVVIVGRSNEVGKPLCNILSNKQYNANVTLLHSKTSLYNMNYFLREADVVIGCCGVANIINMSLSKHGTTFINVGMSRIEDKTKKCGYTTFGDIDLTNKYLFNKYNYTPVFGSTGPLTVLNLLKNTILAYQIQHKSLD